MKVKHRPLPGRSFTRRLGGGGLCEFLVTRDDARDGDALIQDVLVVRCLFESECSTDNQVSTEHPKLRELHLVDDIGVPNRVDLLQDERRSLLAQEMLSDFERVIDTFVADYGKTRNRVWFFVGAEIFRRNLLQLRSLNRHVFRRSHVASFRSKNN